HSVGLRRSAGRLPRVEPEVMVVAARGHEQDVPGRPPPRHVARLVHDVEAEDADIELAYPVDVGGAQVHVADPQVRVDRVLRALIRLDWSLWPAHVRPPRDTGARTRSSPPRQGTS